MTLKKKKPREHVIGVRLNSDERKAAIEAAGPMALSTWIRVVIYDRLLAKKAA